jgi:azurin
MKSLNTILTLVSVIFFVACGGGGQDQQMQSEAASSAEPADDVRTIELVGVDQMKFVVAESQEGVYTSDTLTASGNKYMVVDSISATAGNQLRIKLTNVSSLPPSAMSHNFTLLDLGTDAQAFANASAQAKDNDYIAPDMEEQVVKTTKMLGGGESESITFSVPEKTGKYDYVCTFPGHFAAGMSGKLIVEE